VRICPAFDRPNNSNSPITLGLKVDWQNLQSPAPAQNEPDIAPKIVAVNNNTGFYAARRNSASPIVGRYLKLMDEDFSLVQMDVDGAGMKLKNLRESLKQDVPVEYDDESFAPEDKVKPEAGLPSLRSSGVMLAERRRDLSLTWLLKNAEGCKLSL